MSSHTYTILNDKGTKDTRIGQSMNFFTNALTYSIGAY
jgi:hypothetical protein